MGYVDDLRALVGNRALILAGACVLALDREGRLLMHLRSDNAAWGLPGGYMEPGETLEETARRELREEAGLEAGALDLLGVFTGPDLFYEYPHGDQVHNVTVAYAAREWRGGLRAGDEARALRFFALDALPDEISPPDRPVLARFLETR